MLPEYLVSNRCSVKTRRHTRSLLLLVARHGADNRVDLAANTVTDALDVAFGLRRVVLGLARRVLLLAGGLPVLETSNVSDRLNDCSLDAMELAIGLAARILGQSARYKKVNVRVRGVLRSVRHDDKWFGERSELSRVGYMGMGYWRGIERPSWHLYTQGQALGDGMTSTPNPNPGATLTSWLDCACSRASHSSGPFARFPDACGAT